MCTDFQYEFGRQFGISAVSHSIVMEAALASSPWSITARDDRLSVLAALDLASAAAFARTCALFRADFERFEHWLLRLQRLAHASRFGPRPFLGEMSIYYIILYLSSF